MRKSIYAGQFSCPHMLYWASIIGVLKFLNASSPLVVPLTAPTESLFANLDVLLEFAESHIEDIEDLELKAIPRLLRSQIANRVSDKESLSNLLYDVRKIFKKYCNLLSTNLANSYKKYVRHELAIGGGRLFADISRSDKAFLNVQWRTPVSSKNVKDLNTPDSFLEGQVSTWSKFWTPQDKSEDDGKVAVLLSALRKLALKIEPRTQIKMLPSKNIKRP